jgi:TolA-binding protein
MFYKGKKVSFEMVLSFLNNGLSQKEKESFFAFLLENKNDIDDDSVLGVVLFLEKNNGDIQKLKDKIVEWNSFIENKPFSNKFSFLSERKFGYLKYAAVIAVLVGLFMYVYEKQNSKEVYFEPYETGLPHFLSNNNTLEKWNPAMKAYHDENYSLALKELYTLMDNGVVNDTSLYFSGVIAYKLDRFDLAINMFKQVVDSKSNSFKYDCEYYLGICLYQNEDYDDASRALTLIAQNDQHPYQKEASRLLLLVHEKQKKK